MYNLSRRPEWFVRRAICHPRCARSVSGEYSASDSVFYNGSQTPFWYRRYERTEAHLQNMLGRAGKV
jgi:hypothetical protein